MRVRRSPSGVGAATSRSMPQRNAASVLPEPVGALISVCSPEAIAGHACACAAVGSAKARVNQSRTCGVKGASGIGGASEPTPRPWPARDGAPVGSPTCPPA